jgi:tRNA threonylcarbamoyladenosine biosynthesis protein TsaB
MKLGIETATRNCSVVLWDNQGRFYSNEKSDSQFVHAEELHQMIQELLIQASVQWKDIEAVIVGRGPGSYTGLRIGVSCAKGICYALSIPLFSVSSLMLMVQESAISREAERVLAVMDARRMEVFGGWFEKGIPITVPAAMIFEENVLSEFSNVAAVIGENASKLKGVFKADVVFIDTLPSAVVMTDEKVQEFFQPEDLAYFEPEYVKPFIPTVSKK